MSPSRPDSNNRRHTKRQQQQIKKAAKLRQKTTSKRLRLEPLEPRTMMDAAFLVPAREPYHILARGKSAAFNKDCVYNGNNTTCTTTSPVEVTQKGISAPDGATSSTSPIATDVYPSNTFIPKNGLLTLENGQYKAPVYDANGIFRTFPLTYAQQQELDFSQTVLSPFPLKVVEWPDPFSTTTYKTSLIVATTGKYNFYMTSLGEGFLTIGDTSIRTSRSSRGVTMDLTANTVYPIEVAYRHAGIATSELKIEWEGVGISRQAFVPNNDVTWRHQPGVFDKGPVVNGLVSPAAYFSPEKRLRDDDFAIRYKTKFTVPTTGEYTFFVSSDNIAQLKLGNDVVIAKPSATEANGKRTLTAGTEIDLELVYIHGTGKRTLKFEWSGPNLARQLFTTSQLVSYDYFEGKFNAVSGIVGVVPKLSKSHYQDPKQFFITWKGENTAPLQIGASADEVQKAINALPVLVSTGGSVSVSRSDNGLKYNVGFGGNAWFRPAMMTIGGREQTAVNAVTKFAITKRDPNATIKISDLSRSYSAPITNGNAFQIDNAPLFTPERLLGDRGSLRMSGFLQTPAIGGRFDPIYNNPNSSTNANVARTETGFRVTHLGTSPDDFGAKYTLNAFKDANGNRRPITLFKLGGLYFEAVEDTTVFLQQRQRETKPELNDLQFVARQPSMVVSAPFEGGKLTLRLLADQGKIFTAELRTGKVTVTPNFEFVSFEIGGIVMTPSANFRMTYDKVAEKFSFAINNLIATSNTPTGTPQPYEVNESYRSIVQTFENYKLSPVTYEYATGNSKNSTLQDFTLAGFKAKSGKLAGGNSTGEPFAVPNAFKDVNAVFLGITFKMTLSVPRSGEYTFSATQYGGGHELKINNTTLYSGTEPKGSGKIQLTAGVAYPVEWTLVSTGGSRFTEFNLMLSGPGLNRDTQLSFNQRGSIVGIASREIPADFSQPTLTDVRAAVLRAIDSQSRLSSEQKRQFKTSVQVAAEHGKISITNIPYLFTMNDQDGWLTSPGVLASPIRVSIPRGTISLTKGQLDPIVDLPIDSFEIGQTSLGSNKQFSTTFEPIKPSSAGGFKVAFFQRNTYDKDGAVLVPGNSFGIYGNETQLPLDVAGVKVSGLADLGTAVAPSLIATNGQFNRLSYAVPNVQVNNLIFAAADVGSAKPLTVNYFPPQGSNPKSYVVLGGAVLKPGGTLITTDMKANFGGMGSDGLRIFPASGNTPASFTFGFGVADTFLAGTQAIQSAAGINGLQLRYEPKTKAYHFTGDAFLDFNPTRPHTATDLEFTGTKLAVSATAPDGVVNFPVNRLDGNALNFFFDKRTSINGFLLAPRATANPLRVSITKNAETLTETVGGSFSMQLERDTLFGVMETTSFTGAKFPTAGFLLDFSAVPGQPTGYSLSGITFDGGGKSSLSDTLNLKFTSAKFDGNVIAQGTVGSEPAIIEAKDGKITKAEVTSSVPRQIGDIAYTRFTAKHTTLKQGGRWTFTGPGVFFGKPVEVGVPAPGNPQMLIGGEPGKGFQLQTINRPVEPPSPVLELPKKVELAGLTFDVSAMQQDAAPVDEPDSRTFSLRTPSYSVRIGNTELALSLGMRVKVTRTGEAEVISFSATGKQGSDFTIGSAKFRINTMTVEYVLADKSLQISGQATFSFSAGPASVDMEVTMGTTEKPGLIIKDGAVESLELTVNGTFDILKLSAKAQGLTVAYKKENQEFAIYGNILLSTAPQSGIQVIKDMAVTLGSEATPGIKIADGQLESLDIAITGEINLFKLTAAPQNLRVQYSAPKNQLQITGAVSITLASKLTLTAGLPGDGLLIDTNTGEVDIRGVSLQAERDIKFGVLTIKGLHIDYERSESGEVTIGAGAEVELPSGLAVGGSFKIVDGKLDAISIVFQKNPGILVANGLINIYRLEVAVEGLSDLDNFNFTGSVSATVGPLVKFGGESHSLANVKGTIVITPTFLQLKGEVDLVGGNFGRGQFEGTLYWNETPRVTFNADVRLLPGDVVQGKITAYADIRGNVDFKADMGVFVPNGIPLVGGASLGQLNVELRVRPAEEPSASYVKFGFSDIAINPFRIPTFHGNFRVGFDRNVDYGLGARFFIPLPWPFPDIDYSLDFGGRFQLRDSDDPRIEILAASSLSGTPNGEIVYVGATTLPDDTLIDIYADYDGLGNDGLLIASGIPFKEGSQTFLWEDMASFANPGEPVFVYAVINDQRHAPGFSDYSPQFNAAPGFLATISHPASVSFAAGDVVTFAAATANAIVITDPRRNKIDDSEVEVVLNVGAGTIDLSHSPDNVRYSGEGTGKLTLRGSAADITAALDGLHYVQNSKSDNEDLLEITVRNLPLGNLTGGTKAQVVLRPKALSIEMVASQDDEDPTRITTGEGDETPLANVEIGSINSAYLTGAVVKINGYEPGKDILSLSTGDEFATGIESVFDDENGTLTLTGFEWVEDYEAALRNIAFHTESLTIGKSLTITLADDGGEQGEFTVPLEIVAGHDAPQVTLGANGLFYVDGDGPVELVPGASLDVADDAMIQSITIQFVEDSFVPGVDVLAFTGELITGDFDAEAGILTLTGEGTVSDWEDALKQVQFAVAGDVVTPGVRYLEVTVVDDAQDNSSTTSFFVIAVQTTATDPVSPALTLPERNLTLSTDEDFIFLNPELTLASSSSMILSATVAISENYVMGEDELAVTTIWDGMDAEFDPMTGILTITGFATLYEYEDVLRSVIFVDSAGYRTPGQVEVTYSVNDGLSDSEIEAMLVTIDAAPYLTTELGGLLIYTEGRSTETIPSDISLEYEGTLTGASVTIDSGFSADEDELIFAAQNGITGSYDAATGVLTLSGQASVAAYTTALQTISYRSDRHNPVAGDRIIAYQVQDGTKLSNVAYAWISVEPEVVAPQVTVGTSTAYTEDGAPVLVAPEFSLAAMDGTTPLLAAPERLYGAEISILNFKPEEDQLIFAGSSVIVGEFDPEQGRIYLTGDATFDEYEAAIRNVSYLNFSQVPTTEARQIRIRLLDSGAGGLDNQTLLTQVVIGTPDPVTLVAGTGDDIELLQNSDSISLGLSDLQFDFAGSEVFDVDLRFKATTLPNEALGNVLLADGTKLELGELYLINELAGLTFEPAQGGMGTGEFGFSVAVFDPDTNQMDLASFADSITIDIEGIAASTESEAFVAQAYRDLFGDNPIAEKLTSIAGQLDQLLKRVGRSTNGFDSDADARRHLLEELIESTEHRTLRVESLFTRLLNRAATDSEREIYASGNAGAFDNVRFELLASDEFRDLHGLDGNISYLNAVYQEFVDRDATDSEQTRWIKVLRDGASNRTVVEQIHEKLVDDGSLPNALEALLPELLGRESEFEDEFTFDFSSRDAFLLSVLSSDEYSSLYAIVVDSSLILTQETSAFPSVGVLGDIAGGKAGGTLIAPQYVLVAAHSVSGLPPAQITFTIGGTKHFIEDVFIHPEYDADLRGLEGSNDIAILKLRESVVGIQPSVLSGVSPRLDNVLKLVGFGRQDGLPFGTKRIGSTPPVDDVSFTLFRWTHISEQQNDSDPGDSGSPLFLTIEGVDLVAGLVSGGSTTFSGLGDVATNMRVDVYLDWIKSIVPAITVVDVAEPPSLVLDDYELFIDENSGPQAIGLKVATDSVTTFSVESDKPEMFSRLFIDFLSRSVGDVVFEMKPNQRGTAKILVTARDGDSSFTQTITVTSEERNDPPSIDPIRPVVIDEGADEQTIVLTGISGGIGEEQATRVSIVDAFPNEFFQSIRLSEGGSTGARSSGATTIAFTPTANATGTATITFEVRDAGPDGQFGTDDDMTTRQFIPIMTTTNAPPTLGAIRNQRLMLSDAVGVISLKDISDGNNNAQGFRVTSRSSDPSIVVAPEQVFAAVGSDSVDELPLLPGKVGTATITVTVTDPGEDGEFDTFDDRYIDRSLTVSVQRESSWHNGGLAHDVSGDGAVTPLDALRVINFISRASGPELTPRAVGESQYVDVNNDARATALDALVVINHLARLARARLQLAFNLSFDQESAPEGESPLSPPINSDSRVSRENAVVDEAVLSWFEGDEVVGSSTRRKFVDPNGWRSTSTNMDDFVDDLELFTNNKPSDEDVDLALLSSFMDL